MTRLLAKLAFAGFAHRRLQSALTILVVATATTALTIGFGIGRVADRPFERTFEQTHGPHVTASTLTNGRADLAALQHLPGVVATTGVRPWVAGAFEHEGKTFGIRLVGVPAGEDGIEVSRPLIEDGAWPARGEVLLERSFARFLHLRPGDRLPVGAGSASLTVSGIAVVPAGEPYPKSQPGLAFATEPTLASVAADRGSWAELIGIRIEDADAAPAVAAQARMLLGPGANVDDWTTDRADAAATQRTITVILGIFGVLLLLAGGAVLGTLVGGRLLAQEREVGLLKTAGLTPRQVASVFLLEQVTLASLGCAAGIVAGRLATPLFTSRSASLLNASEIPPTDLARSALAIAAVLAVVTLCTAIPALGIGRRTTADALSGGLAASSGRSRLGALADRIGAPISFTLGARGSFARPGRAALTTLSLALTVAAVVATLGMEASLDVATTPPPAPPLAAGLDTPAWDPVDDDAGEGAALRPVVYSLDTALLFIGLVNLIATLLLAVRDRIRDVGVLKAIGVTPRQVGTSLVSAQVLLAAIATLAGIPLGLALFRLGVGLSGGSDEFAYPAWWTLVLVPPAIVAMVVALTVPIARRAARLSVADALRYE